MNFKLIKQNNDTDKMVVINPKQIKKISLDYKINYKGSDIESITFTIYHLFAYVEHTIRVFLSEVETSVFESSLEDEFKIVEGIFLEDYVKQLCSPNLAQVIIPQWELLVNAVKRAKAENDI